MSTSMSDSAINLNPAECVIKTTNEKGRGVYSSRFIPRNTIIETSPILLFSWEEYETHGKGIPFYAAMKANRLIGKHTILDHYTFKWTDGRMAFALGLGSLFNHSDHPNTSYILEPQTDCIRFVAARDIQPDEELCTFYGHTPLYARATIQDTENEDTSHQEDKTSTSAVAVDGEDDSCLGVEQAHQEIKNPYLEGDPNEVVHQEALPFTKLKPPTDEEDPQSIRTTKAWVVDVPDARHIATLLKWLKQAGHDTPDLGHLKRVRKQNGLTTFLICNAASFTDDDTIEPPSLSTISDPNRFFNQDLALPAPYIISVPTSSALTLTSLALKSAIWPTMYTPRRKDEPEPWTRGKLRWAWDAMKCAVDVAIKASEQHQLPIAAHIPTPYEPLLRNPEDYSLTSFTAFDTRKTTSNPLRHSILNVIREIADHDTTVNSFTEFNQNPTETPMTGTNYLLTDQTVFVTHEPCIMCSMALLHSRVKEVVYLYPMPNTGGCGGCTCLPTLKGVNHRFGIFQWKLDRSRFCQKDLNIEISDTVDA